jgi:glycogen operon protein
VTAHDGFTLHDLVSYNDKHNEANGEDNRDGASDNASWNCGAEGPTDDPEILALRERQKRNLLATLLLSHGTPMLLAGDELGNTQRGNNNVYCQDNKLSWIDWDDVTDEERALTEFVRRTIELRQAEPLLHRHSFRDGMIIRWINPSGKEPTDAEWKDPEARTIGLLLQRGEEAAYPDEATLSVLLFIFNAHHENVTFALPDPGGETLWRRMLDTANGESADTMHASGEQIDVQARSMIVFGSAGA